MSMACITSSNTVYPRWRGEHSPSALATTETNGLSPLARGTPIFIRVKIMVRRFIPAGAGNTGVSIASRTRSAVYPRWRGEHRLPVSKN